MHVTMTAAFPATFIRGSNARDLKLAQSDPGGLWTKREYDAAGRNTATYLTDGAAGTTNLTPALDRVIEQTKTDYDNNGNTILVTRGSALTATSVTARSATRAAPQGL